MSPLRVYRLVLLWISRTENIRLSRWKNSIERGQFTQELPRIPPQHSNKPNMGKADEQPNFIKLIFTPFITWQRFCYGELCVTSADIERVHVVFAHRLVAFQRVRHTLFSIGGEHLDVHQHHFSLRRTLRNTVAVNRAIYT